MLSCRLQRFYGGYVMLILMLGCLGTGNAIAKNYKYQIRVAHAEGYEVMIDGRKSAFYDRRGRRLFDVLGGAHTLSSEWGKGRPVTSMMRAQPLPSRLTMRWYSSLEKKFWEGSYEFNTSVLEKFLESKVYEVSTQEWGNNDYFVSFVVSLLPGGVGVVWIKSMYSAKFLGTFRANQVDMSWDEDFYDYAYDYKSPNKSEEVHFNRVLKAAPADVQREVLAHQIPTDGKPWLDLLTTYRWTLQADPTLPYKVKDYKVFAMNGERYYSYEGKEDTGFRGMPDALHVYLQKPDQKVRLFAIVLEKIRPEVMNAFRELSGTLGLTPVELKVIFDDEGYQMDLIMSSEHGEHKISTMTVQEIAPF